MVFAGGGRTGPALLLLGALRSGRWRRAAEPWPAQEEARRASSAGSSREARCHGGFGRREGGSRWGRAASRRPQPAAGQGHSGRPAGLWPWRAPRPDPLFREGRARRGRRGGGAGSKSGARLYPSRLSGHGDRPSRRAAALEAPHRSDLVEALSCLSQVKSRGNVPLGPHLGKFPLENFLPAPQSG